MLLLHTPPGSLCSGHRNSKYDVMIAILLDIRGARVRIQTVGRDLSFLRQWGTHSLPVSGSPEVKRSGRKADTSPVLHTAFWCLRGLLRIRAVLVHGTAQHDRKQDERGPQESEREREFILC